MTTLAFDPLAGEEASTLGRLTIVSARMNPDLAMVDELLTKTASGNLRHRDQVERQPRT